LGRGGEGYRVGAGAVSPRDGGRHRAWFDVLVCRGSGCGCRHRGIHAWMLWTNGGTLLWDNGRPLWDNAGMGAGMDVGMRAGARFDVLACCGCGCGRRCRGRGSPGAGAVGMHCGAMLACKHIWIQA
jgi:hypothetical protein